MALAGLGVPAIYFAPGATHLLEMLPEIGAAGYGVDWRLPLDDAWRRFGPEQVIQGNLDPALLRSDPAAVRSATVDVLESVAGRPGHIFNLGHGVLPDTPIENVAAMVETVIDQESAHLMRRRGSRPPDERPGDPRRLVRPP